MRTIDGIRYVSAKEYAEMKGITQGRVSQLKNELPFVKFEELGIELINFDLLDLQDHEKSLAQAKFETTTNIYQMSYKDIGLFWGKTMNELVNFKGNADLRIEELKNRVNNTEVAFGEESKAKEAALEKAKDLAEQLSANQIALKSLEIDHEAVLADNDSIKAEAEKMEASLKEQAEKVVASLRETEEELAKQKIINEGYEKSLAVKAVETEKQLAEIEHLKFKIATLEAEKSLKEQLAALFATLNTKNSEKP